MMIMPLTDITIGIDIYDDIPTTQAPTLTTNAAEGRNEIHKDHIGYQIRKYIINLRI